LSAASHIWAASLLIGFPPAVTASAASTLANSAQGSSRDEEAAVRSLTRISLPGCQ
jgi:hypothetical protein